MISEDLSISKETKVDILLGYLEKCDDSIYSSSIMISGGEIIHNYRRISTGWRDTSKTDEHYREGDIVTAFEYKGKKFVIALCGDAWVYPDLFKTEGILLWQLYVNFSLEQWNSEKLEYASHPYRVAEKVLLVNSLSDEPISHGGAFSFGKGIIEKEIAFSEEGILLVEL